MKTYSDNGVFELLHKVLLGRVSQHLTKQLVWVVLLMSHIEGHVFSVGCRDLYSEIQEQQVRLDSIGGSCFKSNLDSCQKTFDVPLTSYTEFIKGLKSVEGCVSDKILANSSCVKEIEADAKERREATEAASETKS